MDNKINVKNVTKNYRNIIIKPEREYIKTKAFLISLSIIFLSLTCLVSATTALFSGENEVKTHVVTGNLDFEFKRTHLIGDTLDEKGYLCPFELSDDVDLTESGVQAFDMDIVVPGSTYTGTFNLKNIGSTAFKANISFVNLIGNNEYLLEKIQIDTEYNTEVKTYSLKEFNQITLDLGNIEVNQSVEFDIGITLPADADNNAQSSEAEFALRLDAVQVLKK